MKHICKLMVLLIPLLVPDAVKAYEVDSLSAMLEMVKKDPEKGALWVRIGYAYLDQGVFKQSKKAFQNGIRGTSKAAAYHGLGLVYQRDPQGSKRKASEYFRRALSVNPRYVEAAMDLARLHVALRESDAEKAFRRVLKIDSTYSPAYLELMDWYANRYDYDYGKELIELCKRYIEVQPDAPEGYYRLGIAYAEDKRYGLVLEIAHAMGERFPMDVRWIALEGQAHAARGDPDRALGLFQHYLQRLPESERMYYEDLSLVALPEELEALKDVPLTDREAFVANFWQQKSGALLLGGPGRRVEHYRRVWYARTFFSRIEPWDRRGEVYIRYGEPDYRSRSGHPNSLPGLAVQYVKEQKAIALYERSMSYRGQEPDRVSLPPVFPGDVFIPAHESFIPPQPGWLWEVKGPSGGDVHLNKPPGLEAGIGPVFPVPRSMYGDILVPWESWVYVDVAGGTEFVFINPYMNGHWNFPAPPHKNLWHTQLVTMLSQSAPAVVLMKIAARTPEYFNVPPGVEVLDFYYATASFKGKKAKTNMEVYFGVPTEQLAEGQTEMLRSIVLADAQGNTTYRLSEEVQEARSLGEMPDGVLVSLASVAVLPGTYQLVVKLVDQNGGKWGMYQQEVTIPEFSDSLGLSDLEVAWNISKNEEAGEFRKGDLWVIPMPSRSYWQNQSVYIYYEVYDLQQDVFNQTHYRVTYSIRQVRQRGRNVFGVLVSGVSKLFSSSKPEIIVSYERKGTEPWERIYFELDTKKIAPGLHQLEVQVEDLHSGQIASQQTVFRLVREMSE